MYHLNEEIFRDYFSFFRFCEKIRRKGESSDDVVQEARSPDLEFGAPYQCFRWSEQKGKEREVGDDNCQLSASLRLFLSLRKRFFGYVRQGLSGGSSLQTFIKISAGHDLFSPNRFLSTFFGQKCLRKISGLIRTSLPALVYIL